MNDHLSNYPWLIQFWALLEPLLPALLISGIILIVITTLATPWFVIRLPEDYFTARRKPRVNRGLLALALYILRNTVATLLILAGIILFMLPGPGILVVLVGVATSTYAGKYKLERAIVRQRSVFNMINWIRARYRRPPIIYPWRRSERPDEQHS